MGKYFGSEEARAYWRAHWQRHKDDYNARRRAKRAPMVEARKAALLAAKKERLARAAVRNARKPWPTDPDELRKYRRAYMRAWKKRNPEKVRERKRGHRERKRLRAYLRDLQGNRCAICGNRLGKEVQVDHIVPRKRGGSNARSNLQLTHPVCNNRKSAKDPIDHARELGRLL